LGYFHGVEITAIITLMILIIEVLNDIKELLKKQIMEKTNEK
jgi:hypothetical protein